MSLKNVSEEILAIARKNSDVIENEGRLEAKKILSDAKKNSEKIKSESEREIKLAIESLNKKSIASSKIAVNRLMLDAKKEIMDKTTKELEARIVGLDDKKRQKLFDALLKNSLKQMPESKRGYVSKKDEAYAKKTIKGLLVVVREMTGGVILENADGTIIIDNTFDTVLETTSKETMKDVCNILFN